jgi:[ribosomal protein S18]-alanine N-acetyltransferase
VESIRIRRFKASDLPSILKIEKTSFGPDAWPPKLFREYARACPKLFLVAAAGRRIVGYSIACIARQAAELASIAVLPEFRGRGVATRLLKALMNKIRREGIASMWLMVRSDNKTAAALYRKLGFVRTSRVPGYYEDGSPGTRMRAAVDICLERLARQPRLQV